MGDTSPASTSPKEEGSEAGTLLASRYEVVREVGRGGMGIVYLCKDIVTQERVALKRLRVPDAAKAQSREEESWWFQQEARAVASLDHPAIVRARDFGTLADGSPYLVMDALPGRSVHEWMHTTTMPWPVIWVLADQVMAGLAHAHARGIIHGDLKPSNIMLDLASAGRGPRAFILDLGLAWLRESRHDTRLDGAPEPELAVHAGAGTVGWVAPEQIRKAAAHVGPPTDLYALACVLYRVMTGKEVFEGTAQEVLRAHKRTPVAPPVLPEGVPAGVGDFIVRLLSKKPWQRYELAADARRAWAQFKPKHAVTMEETIARLPAPPPAAPSSEGIPERGRAVAAARSLAPGLLSLRPSPMVAREAERAFLQSLVDEVCLRDRPIAHRFVALIGEAGVGKSRLAEWLCETVQEQGKMWVLRARYGKIATPLDGLTGAINKFFNLLGGDRALVEQTFMNRWEVEKDDDEALTWVAATSEWLRPTPPGENTPLGPSGKRYVLDNPELRFAVIRRVLERIGYDRPVLLWFDDLHLSSPNTFDVLMRLRRECRTPLLVVTTARSEALETDIDAALRMESLRADWNGRVMEISPMGEEETHVLLRATLPLHGDAITSATRQSRGNPLFALQLLHAWSGGGYLTMEAGRYRVPREALQGRAITTAELWDERLRAVPTNLRLAAYAAAAVGDDVRGSVLKALSQALGMDSRDALVGLTRAQILLPTGNDQFRWAHALLQEHLLARLHERADHPAVFRLAASALALHPAVGSRRVMKLRVTNLLRAGDDDVAAQLMFQFIEGAWSRGRDTAATLRDLALLEGRVTGLSAAEYAHWRAEALRHTGRLEQAREHAESALKAFEAEGQKQKQARGLRLLGHLHSDMGQPVSGREKVLKAKEIYQALGDTRGTAQTLVVLGEIDYLLGEHARATACLEEAGEGCRKWGDELGRAQSLILLAMIQTSIGGYGRAVDFLVDARASFDQIGYRLGIAQCDVVLGHAEHRVRKFSIAWTRAETARAAFRELVNPRGEAAAERLLSMVALDTMRLDDARAHAEAAARIFERLQDPWGDLETRLLLTQVALEHADVPGAAPMKGLASPAELLARCDAIVLDEAEPRQHRHLTRAWMFQTTASWALASREIESARASFAEKGRAGDHTPHLLHRLNRLSWEEPAKSRLDAWLSAVEAQDRGEPVSS
jgi:eukaryotic-like serine/threonine-protein kinase